MPFILTIGGQIMCPHGGVAPLAALIGNPQYQIDGMSILTMMNIGPVPFACPFAPAPCMTVISWIPSQFKMTINGLSVLTDTCKPLTNNGPGSVVFAGQTKVQVL